MKTIKHYFVLGLILFTSFGISRSAVACCQVCFGAKCWQVEGNCSDCPPPAPATCMDYADEIVRPGGTEAYILSVNGMAWIVKNNVKTPIGSDKMAAFMTNMKLKHPKPKSTELEEISLAWSNFFKTYRDGPVSAARLARIQNETHLRVLSKPPTASEQPGKRHTTDTTVTESH